MDDLDSLLEGELASINEMFHEFELKDRQTEKRARTEEEELKKIELKDVQSPVDTKLVSLEEVSRKRSLASETIELQWEKEMALLEQERLALALQEEAKADPEADVFLQNLDNELKSLIQNKEEEVRQTQHEKILRAQREKEEKEKKEEEEKIREQERKERLANNILQETPDEMTVEEWIVWMEEKKKKGMTPAQQEEYERRKKAHIEKERLRSERRKEEEEEQKKRTMARIDNEMRSYRRRQQEIKDTRMTEEEHQQNVEELAVKNAEESRLRKERSQKMRLEDKERELEFLRPKARSALAARWEESVKSRSNGKVSRSKNNTTVLTSKKEEMSLEREEERLLRRISGGFTREQGKLSPDKTKRHSVQ